MQVQDASRLQGAWIDESTGLRGYALARVRRAVKNHQSRQYIAEVCLEPEDDIDRYLAAVDAPVPSDIHTASSSPPLLASSRERTLQPAGTTRGQAAPSRPQTTAERMETRLAGQGRLPSDEAGGPVAPRPAPKAAPLQSTKQRMLARLVRQGRLTAEEAKELAG